MNPIISKNLYDKYNNMVTTMTNAKQRLEPGRPRRGLSDREIAERLDLSVEEVIEIRSIAENERIPLESYMAAEKVKEDRFERIPGRKGSSDEDNSGD